MWGAHRVCALSGACGGAVGLALAATAALAPKWPRLGHALLAVAVLVEAGRAAVSAFCPRPEAPLPRQARQQRNGPRHPRTKHNDLCKGALFLPASAAALFFLLVLFGAPALDKHEETFTLACLLTALAVFPLCAYAGVDATVSCLVGARRFTGDDFAEMLQRNAMLCLVGAWCGAIVVPLDWDRPWQAWPVPCYVGAFAGYSLSQTYTLIKLTPFVAERLARKAKY